MYCKVNQELCIACGLCQIKAPLVFDYTEEGLAFIKQSATQNCSELMSDYKKDFLTAYYACPTHAILKQDHPFSQ